MVAGPCSWSSLGFQPGLSFSLPPSSSLLSPSPARAAGGVSKQKQHRNTSVPLCRLPCPAPHLAVWP